MKYEYPADVEFHMDLWCTWTINIRRIFCDLAKAVNFTIHEIDCFRVHWSLYCYQKHCKRMHWMCV